MSLPNAISSVVQSEEKAPEPKFRAEDGALRSSAFGSEGGLIRHWFQATDGRPSF